MRTVRTNARMAMRTGGAISGKRYPRLGFVGTVCHREVLISA
jgi:hypothetical protein